MELRIVREATVGARAHASTNLRLHAAAMAETGLSLGEHGGAAPCHVHAPLMYWPCADSA